eukprot:scaffold116001_cov53-Attheya_sp.AAC.2
MAHLTWLGLVVSGWITDSVASFAFQQPHGFPSWRISRAIRHDRTYMAAATKSEDGGWEMLVTNGTADTIISSRQSPPAPKQAHCQFCSASFASRNAMFRHIKTNPDCLSLARQYQDDNDNSAFFQDTTVRHSVALLFGYYRVDEDNNFSGTKDTTSQGPTECNIAGKVLREAFELALREYADDAIPSSYSQNSSSLVQMISATQSSVAKMRHFILSQERGCASSGDVMMLSYHTPSLGPGSNDSDMKTLQQNVLQEILKRTNQKLLDTSVSSGIQVKILSAQALPGDTRMHAERSCTQRVYHYLLPIRWLPNGTQLERWFLLDSNVLNLDEDPRHRFAPMSKREHQNRSGPPPDPALKLLKDALRQAESQRLPPTTNETDPMLSRRMATGRFGALARKERRPWHNFADPNLRGDASPNNEPVWRVLDRARVVQFLHIPRSYHAAELEMEEHDNEVVAVLEFRGDSFVPQQIRRIVGTAVAMSHDYLPNDFFHTSTSPDVSIETPLAPPGRLYTAGSRFHFEDLFRGGRDLFDTDNAQENERINDWICELRQKIINATSTLENRNLEEQWLESVKDNIAPQICNDLGLMKNEEAMRMRQQSQEDNLTGGKDGDSGYIRSKKNDSVFEPPAYARTLKLLRDIVAEQSWPMTSVARSRVIRKSLPDVVHDPLSESKPTNLATQAGSFTVVNPKFGNGMYADGIGNESLPLGNILFPDLAAAVFQLEEDLSLYGNFSFVDKSDTSEHDNNPSQIQRNVMRLPSSHCAVNRNAEFTPHVDSGRGAGQTLSLIVGLGDYEGGDLMVEGEPVNIQYSPLEFDGWKLRHWTRPFVGERLSLVWFTPE